MERVEVLEAEHRGALGHGHVGGSCPPWPALGATQLRGSEWGGGSKGERI
jgi:hypothetical protein